MPVLREVPAAPDREARDPADITAVTGRVTLWAAQWRLVLASEWQVF
jgi:predicted fused transcriptional regulator/phosphomethylpyrimidine kinase